MFVQLFTVIPLYCLDLVTSPNTVKYPMHTIIRRCLYIFIPFFTAVYNQERLMLQTIYAINKEIHQ